MGTSLIAMTLVVGVLAAALPGILSGSMRLGMCGGYLAFSHIAITTRNPLLLTAFVVATVGIGLAVGGAVMTLIFGDGDT